MTRITSKRLPELQYLLHPRCGSWYLGIHMFSQQLMQTRVYFHTELLPIPLETQRRIHYLSIRIMDSLRLPERWKEWKQRPPAQTGKVTRGGSDLNGTTPQTDIGDEYDKIEIKHKILGWQKEMFRWHSGTIVSQPGNGLYTVASD